MKRNLKVVAAAVALVAASSAHADFVGGANSTLVLAVWNTVTKSAYYRDTGFFLNSFLPNSVTTAPGDGGVTGTMTPEAGLTLDKTNTASFADAAFSTWLGTQSVSDIRWTMQAGDAGSAAGTNNVSRLLLATSGSVAPAVTNSSITNAQSLFGGFASLGTVGLSTTVPTVFSSLEINGIGDPSSVSLLGGISSLYYFARTQGTLANSGIPTPVAFSNSLNTAQISLASNGDFSYVLAPADVAAVPIPAAAWLLGSGLLAIGGAARRRKVAAQA